MKRVLVADGNQRSALAITRALGEADFIVFVADSQPQTIAGASKYCRQYFHVASMVSAPGDFFRDIIRIVNENKIDFLIPATDLSCSIILPRANEIPAFCQLPTVDFATYHSIANKANLIKIAQRENVSVPETVIVNGWEDLKAKLQKINFPVVAKPSFSRQFREGHWINGTVKYAENAGSLLELFESDEAFKFPSLIQEVITGPGTGYFALFRKGKLLAEFAHRRIREKPPSGGVSVCCESIPIPESVREQSLRLLKSLNWNGVAMVEWKYDIRKNQFFLMEINGRFWGSLQLAIHSGVNFPVLLLESFAQKHNMDFPVGRTGLRMHWILGELDHQYLKSKIDGHPLWYFLPAIFTFFKNILQDRHYDVFRIADIRPFLQEIKQYLHLEFV